MYTYEYNRVYLAISKDGTEIAFLQDECAHELYDEIEKLTPEQQQVILEQYDVTQ